MGFTKQASIVLVASVSFLGALSLNSASFGTAAPATVSILFDLGDGTYYWSHATVPDPTATNASWTAFQEAAKSLGLSISWTWYSCCGVAITDVGGRNSPAGFVGLYLWNTTARAWNFATVGISSLVLHNGDALALDNAGFDSTTFAGRFPVPTPEHPNPALEFRGDAANQGSSRSEAPNSNRVLWDRDAGVLEIDSSPAVAYGRAFVNTMKGLFALDAETGRVVWTNPIVTGSSSPAVFDGALFVDGSNGRLYRVNATNGKELWNVTLLTQPRFSGITSSPKVAFDWVYLGTFNETGGPGEVDAIWVSNGTVLWRHQTASVHWSSPAIADGTVYVGLMGRYNTTTQITFNPPYGVLALYASNGTQRWFFPTQGSVAASPLLAGSLVVVPSKDGSVYAIDRSSGRLIWHASIGAGVSSPALWGTSIFVGGGAFGGEGRFVTLNVSTGAIVWSFAPNGPVQASASYADGKVFFSTNTANGTVYALNATSGEVVWTYTPHPTQFILGSPVVADGTLFVSSDNGHIYAFRDPAPALLSLNLTSPVSIDPGAESVLNVTIRDRTGRASAALLTATLPAQLTYLGGSPTETQRAGNVVTWNLGSIAFGAERSVLLRVQAAMNVPAGIQLTAFVNLSYRDNDGFPYPVLSQTASLAIVGTPPPTTTVAPLVIGGALVTLAAVASIWLLYRRKRKLT